MTDKITPIRTRKTKTAKVAGTQPDAKRDEAQMAFDIYSQSLGAQGVQIKSIRHGIAAVVVSLAVLSLGIVVGSWVAGLIATASMALGLHSFFAAIIYVMVYLVSVIASMYAGGLAARYVATGAVVDDLNKLGAWVRSKFETTSSYVKQRMGAEAA